MVVLAVTWVANPGQEEEVAQIFGKLEIASRLESGCLMYIVHRHKDDARTFFIYEQYKDEAALQAHKETSHFQEYAVKGLKDIGVRKQGDLYTPLSA
jgi:(4S)-4-hydroxy-5-phosphonooxypentane-2,3-dione isomerase